MRCRTCYRCNLPVIFIVLFILLIPAGAAPLGLGAFGNFIDMPEGWAELGSEDEKLTWEIGGQKAFLQIKRFPGETSIENLVNRAASKIDAHGDGSLFTYGSTESYFGTVEFSAGGFDFSGYLLATLPQAESETDPVVLLGFSEATDLPAYNDFILSALDSYSPDPSCNRLPGPVAFFDRLFSAGKPAAVGVTAGGINFTIELDSGLVESACYVSEREARILSVTATVTAWTRFYRMLYRDALAGVEPLISHLHTVYPDNPGPEEASRIARELLSWLQQFTYKRSGTLSDFLDPLQAVISRAGDCDSLGLLYALILHSFDIDAILLVSEKYGHAMGAVDVPGNGARITVDGTPYLVAELTDDVAIGLIDRNMADPAGWIPVIFPDYIHAEPPRQARSESGSWR